MAKRPFLTGYWLISLSMSRWVYLWMNQTLQHLVTKPTSKWNGGCVIPQRKLLFTFLRVSCVCQYFIIIKFELTTCAFWQTMCTCAFFIGSILFIITLCSQYFTCTFLKIRCWPLHTYKLLAMLKSWIFYTLGPSFMKLTYLSVHWTAKTHYVVELFKALS